MSLIEKKEKLNELGKLFMLKLSQHYNFNDEECNKVILTQLEKMAVLVSKYGNVDFLTTLVKNSSNINNIKFKDDLLQLTNNFFQPNQKLKDLSQNQLNKLLAKTIKEKNEKGMDELLIAKVIPDEKNEKTLIQYSLDTKNYHRIKHILEINNKLINFREFNCYFRNHSSKNTDYIEEKLLDSTNYHSDLKQSVIINMTRFSALSISLMVAERYLNPKVKVTDIQFSQLKILVKERKIEEAKKYLSDNISLNKEDEIQLRREFLILTISKIIDYLSEKNPEENFERFLFYKQKLYDQNYPSDSKFAEFKKIKSPKISESIKEDKSTKEELNSPFDICKSLNFDVVEKEETVKNIIAIKNKKSIGSENSEIITENPITKNLQKKWDEFLLPTFFNYNLNVNMATIVSIFLKENNLTEEKLKENNINLKRFPISDHGSQWKCNPHQFICRYLAKVADKLFVFKECPSNDKIKEISKECASVRTALVKSKNNFTEKENKKELAKTHQDYIKSTIERIGYRNHKEDMNRNWKTIK